MTEMLVTKMLYRTRMGDNNEVLLYGRCDDGKRKTVIITDAEPYFYVHEIPKDHAFVRKTIQSGVNLKNQKLWKIYTRKPGDIKIVRTMYDYHYEADVPFTDRVRVDYGIKTQIRYPNGLQKLTKDKIEPVERTLYPETVYFDIETMDDKGFTNPEFAAHQVVCLDMYSTEHDSHIALMTGKVDKEKVRQQFKEMCQKYFKDDGPNIIFKEVTDERNLFDKFRTTLEQINPDIIAGWNVDYFDVQTMENRAKNQQYSMPDYRTYSVFDLMKGYDRLHTGKTFKKLEYVAQKELGVGKLPRDKIHIMFKNDKEKLCLYNIWDVELCRRIDIARNVLVRHLNFAWFAGTDLEKTHYSEPLLDKYILHEIQGKVILPSKDMLKKTGIDKGALVADPVKGRYDLVAVLDFASMYPNSIISCNISPETQVKPEDNFKGETFNLPSGRTYYKSPPGFIPIIVSRLMNMRKQVKDEMKKFEKGTVEYKRKYEEQTSVKYFINSAYGIVGSESFRLADGDVASDVTHLGRVLIQYTIDTVKGMGYTPLYADTDSIYFQTDATTLEEAVEKAKNVEKILNGLYKEYAKTWNGSKECTHNIKCEKVYQTWLQAGAKKRHCGLVGWDYDTEEKYITHLSSEARLDVKGFEIVRANASKLTKRIQKEVVIMALESKDYKDELIRYLRELHTDFFAGKYDLDILIPGSSNKEEYKVKSAHIRAMEYSLENKIANLEKGDPYTWFYVHDVQGKPHTDVVALDIDAEIMPDNIKINYEKMWERSVGSPLSHILDALDIDLNIIVQKQRQTTLF